jgi:NTP pyrophosphatase (non-canonical NTP hydrolase)
MTVDLNALFSRVVRLGDAAVKHYGRDAERLMIVEELGECLATIAQHARDRREDWDVRDEVADAIIVLVGYCTSVHGAPWDRMEAKLDRLEGRLRCQVTMGPDAGPAGKDG